MSEQPSPVRAWAEYDEIALFWHEDDAQTWLTPKGEGWCPSRFDDVPWIVATMEQLQLLKHGPGPLRTLRVLLSTGHEVRLFRYTSFEDHWGWTVSEIGVGGHWDRGGMTDAEMVARAVAEAVAWVSEQSGVKA